MSDMSKLQPVGASPGAARNVRTLREQTKSRLELAKSTKALANTAKGDRKLAEARAVNRVIAASVEHSESAAAAGVDEASVEGRECAVAGA
jgi:hypothetical protein